MKKLLEIAAFSAEGALIAAEAGADRIELCSGYREGGLSPSIGTLRLVKEHVKVPVYVMLRPRGGDFFYNEKEMDVMKYDIENFRKEGADGFVAGVLQTNYSVNEKQLTQLIGLIQPLPVTFHRAFDLCYDPLAEMETLIGFGIQRILTSGQKNFAEQGAGYIAQLNIKSAGRITIMPGGGINPENILKIAEETGCTEFHASAKRFSTMGDIFGFGQNDLPHPEMVAELKRKLAL